MFRQEQQLIKRKFMNSLIFTGSIILSGSILSDTTAPTMVISSSTDGVSNGSASYQNPIELTFLASESTSNFDVSDITVAGGALSDFTGSGASYSATFEANGEGLKTIDIAEGTSNSGTSSGEIEQIGSEITHEGFYGGFEGFATSINGDGTIVAVGELGYNSFKGRVRVLQYSSDTWSNLGSEINLDNYPELGDTRYLGMSVSLSSDGKTLAVTSPCGSSNKAYVFEYDDDWQLSGEFDFSNCNYSQISLSSDGTTVAVGNDRGGSSSAWTGVVDIYRKSGSSWGALGSSIYGEGPRDYSGHGVVLNEDGTRVAIGGYQNDDGGNNAGHVRVYQYAEDTWSQLGSDIDGEAAGDLSGDTVSINADGSIIAIGGYQNDDGGNNAGHVRVYQYAEDTWSQLGSDIDGEAAGDSFGASVSLSSDGAMLAVGAPGNGGGGYKFGSTRLYSYSDGIWSQIGSDIDNDHEVNSTSGGCCGTYGVALAGDGSALAVSTGFFSGDPGSTRIYGTGTSGITSGFSDAAGNTNTASDQFSYTYDSTFPVVTLSDLVFNINEGETALGSVSADEAVTWSVSGTSVSVSSSGVLSLDIPANFFVATYHSFVLTATDTAGNSRHIPTTIQVNDVTSPTIDYSGLVKSIKDGDTALGTITADEPVTWAISGDGVSISNEGVISLDTPADYRVSTSHQYRVTATDKQGGAGTIGYTFVVFVMDITSPNFDYSGLVTAINDGGTALGTITADEPVIWSISGSGVSINSSGAITLDVPADFRVKQSYQYKVTAKDKQGGAGRIGYDFIVEVKDITSPNFNYDLLLEGIDEGSTALGTITADEPVNWSISGNGVSIDEDGHISLDAPANYEVARYYTYRVSATDKQGGAGRSGYNFTAIVNDKTAPVISLVGEVNVIIELGYEYSDAGATATDNADGDITASITAVNPVDVNTVGTYKVTYNVSDAQGNAAAQIIRMVEVTSDVTIPVISLEGEAVVTIEKDSVYVDAGATATDNTDGDISSSIQTINSVSTASVGTYTVTYNVKDAAENPAAEVTRAVTVVPIAISFSMPDDITVDAVGYLTNVDIGDAIVSDGDGPIIVTSSRVGPFISGAHEIVWTATDSVGSVESGTQILKVLPLANLGTYRLTTEGDSPEVQVLLSGEAADYPVLVPFETSGTAIEGEDYNVTQSGIITIEEGTVGTINLDIVADEVPESEETIEIILGDPINAARGATTAQTWAINEGNLPPKATLTMSQGGVTRSTLTADGGTITATVSIMDANSSDQHTIDWTGALNYLPDSVVVTSNQTLRFSAASMPLGVTTVSVGVSDGTDSVTVFASALIISTAPGLPVDVDTDGDGLSDNIEGFGDSDGDGIPNYQDNIDALNIAPMEVGFMQTEAGTRVSLGSVSLEMGDNNVSVAESELIAAGIVIDSGYDYPSQLTDFVVSGADLMYSYKVVIPLTIPVPDDAVYRKYIDEDTGWEMFVEDAYNALATAPAVDGVCPETGSLAYDLGLNIGDNCLQLVVQDGGPNDADGSVNAMVIDLGGIAVKYIGTPSTDSEAVLSSTQLDADGSDNTTITVTVYDNQGLLLQHMNVSGSVGLSGSTVSAFTEQGDGVYRATVTAGTVSGNGPVTVVIDNGTVSATISSQTLNLNAVNQGSTNEGSGSGGGCSVSKDGEPNSSLVLLLLLLGLVSLKRRINVISSLN